MKAAAAICVLALAALAPPARADVGPHTSWSLLPWSNGYAASYYDVGARRIKSFREHLYAQPTPTTSTRELMYDMYFGLRDNGNNAWLSDLPIEQVGYEPGTGVVRVVQSEGDLQATEYFTAPFSVNGPVLVALIAVKNVGTAATQDAAVFSIQNLHVGGGASGTDSESITWTGDAYEERGPDGRLVLHHPIPAPTVHSATPDDPWGAVNTGGHMTSVDQSGVTNDAVAGFEWNLSGLAPGATRWFAVVIGYDAGGDRAAIDNELAPITGLTPAKILDQVNADWASFQQGAKEPDGLSADEDAVYRHQLAILRMAQVREPAPARGQIVASMPPGQWNITWVRDQAYATNALIDAGLYDQAEAALQFILGGTAGHYVCCDQSGGPYVGENYAVSVVRYTGNGVEQSDSNQNGPNIEFDGFGLTLMAIDHLVQATGDTALLKTYAQQIFNETADVLVDLVDSNTGLLRADSSIWETHWENGGRLHHTYTQLAAVGGLRAAADLADAAGRASDATRYRNAADGLAKAIASQLVDPTTHVLRSSLEETQNYVDAAVAEAFNWNVLPPDGDVARATLDAFKSALWNGTVGHGYHRNQHGGEYDLREWIIADLRIATADRRAGRDAAAAALLSWVTGQARANYDLIPENYNATTGDYQGAVPMAGFGAGTYVQAMWDRAAYTSPAAGPDGGVGGADGGPGGTDGGPGGMIADAGPGGAAKGPAGCGCQVGGRDPGPGGWILVALAALAALAAAARRRRSG